jgi:hypothetical protein
MAPEHVASECDRPRCCKDVTSDTEQESVWNSHQHGTQPQRGIVAASVTMARLGWRPSSGSATRLFLTFSLRYDRAKDIVGNIVDLGFEFLDPGDESLVLVVFLTGFIR